MVRAMLGREREIARCVMPPDEKDDVRRFKEVFELLVDDDEESGWQWFREDHLGVACTIITDNKKDQSEESSVFSMYVAIVGPWELTFRCVFDECKPLSENEVLTFEALFSEIHREHLPLGTFITEREEIVLFYDWYVPPVLSAVVLLEEVSYLLSEIIGTCLLMRPIFIKLHCGTMTLKEALLLISNSKAGNA